MSQEDEGVVEWLDTLLQPIHGCRAAEKGDVASCAPRPSLFSSTHCISNATATAPCYGLMNTSRIHIEVFVTDDR